MFELWPVVILYGLAWWAMERAAQAWLGADRWSAYVLAAVVVVAVHLAYVAGNRRGRSAIS